MAKADATVNQSKANRQARSPLWSVPVGVQLSAIYTLLLAATLALLGWALYAQLEGFLVQNTAERLEAATRPTLVRTPPFGERGEPREPPGSREPREPRDTRVPPNPGPQNTGPEQMAAFLVRELGSRSNSSVAVLDAQGNVISSTLSVGSDLAQIPPLPEGWQDKVNLSPERQGAQALKWIVPNRGGERQLAVLTPITVRARDGSPETTLLVEQVTSLGAADAVLNQVRLYVLLGIILGTLIGVVAGLALTRAVLRPLDRMVYTAEAIAGGDLKRRLRLPTGRNEIARLGSAFDHMVDRLGTALDAQKRFVADASHELRTPLTSMEGLSEMLLMGADRGDTKVVQRTVRSIHSELGRLGRLVSDLLTLSRLDNTTPVRPAPVDMGKLLTDVADQMRPLAEAKGVRLGAVCRGNTVVQGEGDRLKQVFLNLVDNAIRYTPEGGDISLRTAPGSNPGEIEIEVRDTGPGIAPQDVPRIFDRFYRGDASRARATGNTGLGLAIARAIVEAHHGTIGVESTPGEGATFRVAIPAVGHPPHPQLHTLPQQEPLTDQTVREQIGSEPNSRRPAKSDIARQ